jgi:MerR family transcriptional regulator, heat shock protein HspR
MSKYYLQLFRQDQEPGDRKGSVFIYDLPFQPLLLERLAAIGIIEIRNGMLSKEEVERIRKVLRIRQSLGVNLAGAAIIIELMDRLEAMEVEIERRRQVKNSRDNNRETFQ